MSRVHFSSRANSTLFTNCCGSAICDDQHKCPGCGEDIPYSPRQRRDMAMRDLYGCEEVKEVKK